MNRLRALLVCIAVVLSACSAQSDVTGYVADMSAAHQDADQAIARGDRPGALRTLEAALARPAPNEIDKSAQTAVRKDLLYRIAEIELETGAAPRAVQRATEGLSLGTANDLFTANLYIVRGRARERAGQELEAAEDYYEALRISDLLLEDALAEQGQEPGR